MALAGCPRIHQAWRVDEPAAVVQLSGQVSVDADGNLVGADDFEVQARQCFDNPASTAVEIAALAIPGLMIELDATAAL